MKLYATLVRSCTTERTLLQVHAYLLTTGLHKDALAATKLIESHAKMGSTDSAGLIFDRFPKPDSFMWGVMIKCYVWGSLYEEAISLYDEMESQRLRPTSFIFSPVLRACSGLHDVTMGRKIHGKIIKAGFAIDSVVETSLLQMYGDGKRLEDAHRVFDGMSTRDVVAWSSMISSYVRCGRAEKGLEIFSYMKMEDIEPDSVIMMHVAQACAELGFLKQGKSVHGFIIRRWTELDEFLETSLITMYSRYGNLYDAEKFFWNSSRRSVVSWTAMISCYNERSCYSEALQVYSQMQKSEVEPNSVTMMGVVLSCTQLGCLKEGKSIHGFVMRRSIDHRLNSIGTALINMYASFGRLGDGLCVFEATQKKTIVPWNSIIAAYAQNGYSERALQLFIRMLKGGLFPDSFTFSSALPACGHIGDLSLGTQIHGLVAKSGFQRNEFVYNSLIDMYSRCRSIDTAYRIFEEIKAKKTVTWNVMMNGFCQNGNSIEAMALFDLMLSEGTEMDAVSFLSAIQACSQMGSLVKGRRIHHRLVTTGLEKNTSTETALTNLYSKCGDLYMARKVFDHMSQKNVAAWTSMIACYGSHGRAEDAISVFSRMLASGMPPNEVTFMSILSACGHAGMVEEGLLYFDMMQKKFGIEPQQEHYACVVDLLSRAGLVGRAYSFIKSMPLEPNASVWRALLSGCSIDHGNDAVASSRGRTMGMWITDLEQDDEV